MSIKQSYLEALEQDPAQVARVLATAKEYKQDPYFVASNLEKLKPLAEAYRPEVLDEYAKRNPEVSKWLSDKTNMAVAKNDLPILGRIENIIKGFSYNYQQGEIQTKIAELSEQQRIDTAQKKQRSFLNEKKIKELEKQYQQLKKESEPYQKSGYGIAQALGEQLPNMIFAGKRALTYGAGAGVTALGVGALLPIPEEIVTVPTAFRTGVRAGIFSATKELESGFAYKQYTDEGLDPIKASEIAEQIGIINAGIETAQNYIIEQVVLSPILKGASKLVKNSPIGQAIFKELSENTSKYTGMSFRDAVVAIGKNFARGSVGAISEIGEEVSQEAVTLTGGKVLKKEDKPVTQQAKEVLSQASEVIVPTFKASLIPSLLGIGTNIYLDTRRIGRVEQEKVTYENLAKEAKESDLRKTSPDKFNEAITKLTEDSPIENVNIPVEEFETYFQDLNINPEDAINELGLGDKYREAKETGGSIQVPLGQWLADTADSEHGLGLSKHIKFNEDGFTVAEAKDIKDAIDMQVGEIESRVNEIEKGYNDVYNYIYQQQLNAGKPKGITQQEFEKSIDINSQIFARQAITESVRRNIPIEEYFTGQRKPQVILDQGIDARGSIQLGQDSSVINLFQKADPTTFLHESSHLWLSDRLTYVQQEGASQEVVDDVNKIKDFLGFEEGQINATTDQQEKFASAFEAYLKNGVAPSAALKKAFSTLRRWLNRIYGLISGVRGIEVSPELKTVFDRMLATNEEIEAMQLELLEKAFIPEYDNLTGKEKEKVKSFSEKVRQKALDIMLPKVMKELSEDSKKRIVIATREAKEKFTKEISEQEIYRHANVIETLLYKTKKPFNLIAKSYLDGTMSKDKVIQFDGIAQSLKYSSGNEFAKILSETKPLQEEIRDTVSAYINFEFSQYNTKEKIRELAIEALHTNRSLELLTLQAELIRDNENIEKVIQQSTFKKAQFNASLIEAKVNEIISKKTIKEIAKFTKYITQERISAIKATKAIEQKRWDDAIKYKNHQIINHALAKRAMQYTRIINKNIAYLNKTRVLDKKAFKKEIHFEQVDAILKRFGFVRSDSKEIKSQSLQSWLNQANEATDAIDIPDFVLDETAQYPFKNLTFFQSLDVVNAVKAIRHFANTENKAISFVNKVDLSELATKLYEKQQQTTKDRRKQKLTRKKSFGDKIKDKQDWLNLKLVTAETLFRQLDGADDLGLWWTTFYGSINDVSNKASRMKLEATNKFKELTSLYSDQEKIENADKLIMIDEINDSLTKNEIIAMALNWGNLTSRQRLTEGRIWNAKVEEFTQSDIESIFTNHLDKKDWQFIQGTWDLIGSYWGDITRVYEETTGFPPEKIESAPFEIRTKDGDIVQVNGGYYPLTRDPRSVMGKTADDINELKELEKSTLKAYTKNGYSKKRAEYASYPVNLDLGVITRHLVEVINDINYRPTLLDLNRVLSKTDVRQALSNAFGDGGYKTINDWLKDFAGIGDTYDSDMNGFYSFLKNRAVVFVLIGKAGTVFKQFLGFPASLGISDKFATKDLAMSINTMVYDFTMNHKLFKDKIEFAKNQSEYIRKRLDGQIDRDMNKAINDVIRPESKIKQGQKKIVDFMSGMLTFTDGLVTVSLWNKAYEIGLREYNGDNKKAVEFADIIARRSQGSSEIKDQAKILRDKTATNLFTLFYTQANAIYNNYYEAFSQVDKFKDVVNAKTMGAIFGAWIIPYIGEMLIEDMLKREDDKDDESLAEFFTNMAIYPLKSIPIARDVSATFMNRIAGKPFTGSYSPVGSVADKFINFTADIFKPDKTLPQRLEGATGSSLILFGMPDAFRVWFWNFTDAMILDNYDGFELSDIVRRRK